MWWNGIQILNWFDSITQKSTCILHSHRHSQIEVFCFCFTLVATKFITISCFFNFWWSGKHEIILKNWQTVISGLALNSVNEEPVLSHSYSFGMLLSTNMTICYWAVLYQASLISSLSAIEVTIKGVNHKSTKSFLCKPYAT